MLIDRSSLVVGENYNKYHRLNGDYHESSGFIFHSSIVNFACARAFIFHSFYAWNVHSSNAFRAFMKMTQLYEIEVDLLGIIARCLYKAIYLNRTHKCIVVLRNAWKKFRSGRITITFISVAHLEIWSLSSPHHLKKTLLLFIPHRLINRHEIDLIWAGFRFDGIKKFASVHIFDNLKSIFYNMLIAGNHINPSGNVKYTYWSCRITLSVYLVSIQLIKTLTSIEHQAPEIEITHAIS